MIYDTDKEHVQEILNQLQKEVDQFNVNRKSIPTGLLKAGGFRQIIMNVHYVLCLIKQITTYENKQKTKAGRKDTV